jgi:hypothetical protein
MLFGILLCVVLFLQPFTFAQAEELTHQSGFKFFVPDTWDITNESNFSFVTHSPDGNLSFLFVNTDAYNLENVAKGVGQVLNSVMRNYSVGEVTSGQVNGLPYFVCYIKGRIDGVTVLGLCYTFLNPRRQTAMMTIAFVPAKYFDHYKKDITFMIGQIRST